MGLLEKDLVAQTTWLRRLAMALVRDRDLAEDLVQDTWVAAFRHRPNIEGSARPWLATVIRNLARSRARQTRRQRLREERVTPEENLPSSEALALRYEALRVLGELVTDLPDPYRATVLLCYGEGISPSEIARRTDVPPGTVRRRLKEGLDRIRARLEERQGPQWRSALLLAAVPVAKTVGPAGQEAAGESSVPDGHGVVERVDGPTPGSRPHVPALVAPISAPVLPASMGALALALLGAVVGFVFFASHARRREAAMSSAGQAPVAAHVERLVPRLVGRTGGASSPSLDAQLAWAAQPGVTPRRIAGTVTFAGQPVAGARVLIAPQSLSRGSKPAEESRSGPDGRFDFGVRPATEYWIAAVAPGRAMEYIAADLRNPIERPLPDQLILALGDCEHQLGGRILDQTGTPIGGADVRLYGLFSVRSDAEGRYEMCTPPGRVDVQVQAAGYGTISVNTLAAAHVARDITLLPHVVVTGRVERVSPAGNEPVAGALVAARSSVTRDSERYAPRISAVTDADGHFSIPGLNPGRWLISASGDGVGESDVMERVLSVGAASDPLVLHVSSLQSRRGRMLVNGAPVVGVPLRAVAKQGAERSAEAVSQTDGSFVLDRVPGGAVEYDIVGYKVASVDEARRAGDLTTIHVIPQGRLRGRILREGQPVAYARIRVVGGAEDADAMSTPDGRFEVTDLAAGNYRLDAHDDRSARAARTVSFTLAAGEQRENLDIALDLAGVISGRLIDQNGRAVSAAILRFAGVEAGLEAGSTVEVVRSAERVRAASSPTLLPEPQACATDSAGRFDCPMLAPGTYRPSVLLSSYARAPLAPARGNWPTVAVAEATSRVAGVTLVAQVAGVALRGQVIDESGQPLADAQIEAEPDTAADGGVVGFRAGQPRPRTLSDGQGQWSFAALPPGRYAVRARAPSGAEALVRGIEAGGPAATLLARSPGSIEGVFSGYAERPDIQVESLSTGDRIRAEVRGDARFSAGGLPAGRYLLRIMSGAETETHEISIGSGERRQLNLSHAMRLSPSSSPSSTSTSPLVPRTVSSSTALPAPSANAPILQ